MADRSRDLHSRIIRDPRILAGKPVVRGTRIAVEHVLAHLSGVPDFDDLFAAYPELTPDDVKAVMAYAQDAVQRERTVIAAAAAIEGSARRST